MSWTEITRKTTSADELRYASDLGFGVELIEPLMPRHAGAPSREVTLRVDHECDSLIAGTGLPMACAAKRLPPCSTVRYYFYKMAWFRLMARDQWLFGPGNAREARTQGHSIGRDYRSQSVKPQKVAAHGALTWPRR